MSINVVSTPMAPIQSPFPGGTGDAAATGMDFASFLLSQIPVVDLEDLNTNSLTLSTDFLPEHENGDTYGGLAEEPKGDSTVDLLCSWVISEVNYGTLTATENKANLTVSTADAGKTRSLPQAEASPVTDDLRPAKLAASAAALINEPSSFSRQTETSAPTMNALPMVMTSLVPPTAVPREYATPLPVTTSLYDTHWNNDFSQKITWLATHQKQFAELTLNPPNMGNIEVSLHVDSKTNTATAHFVSTHADVRESIETALPRLREMFANAGISLGETNVSAESFRQASNQWNGAPTPHHWGNDHSLLEPDSPESHIMGSEQVVYRGHGLVDTFI